MGLRLSASSPRAPLAGPSLAIALLASLAVSAFAQAPERMSGAFAIFDGAFGGLPATARTIENDADDPDRPCDHRRLSRQVWNIGAENNCSPGPWRLRHTMAAMGIALLPFLFVAGFVGSGLYGGLGWLSAFRVNRS